MPTEPSQDAVELPGGVERYRPDLREAERMQGFPGMEPHAEGEFVRVSDLPAIRNRWEQEVRERLLSDEAVKEATLMHEALHKCTQEWRAKQAIEAAAEVAFGEAEPVEEGRWCGGSPGNPRPVDRGSGPDGKGRLPWKLCSSCRDCQPEAEPVEGEGTVG